MKWKNTWKYLPVNYNTSIGYLENATQTTIFKNNLRGEKVRLLFSNRYAKEPLTLEKVYIGKEDADGNVSSFVPVTSKGQGKINIPAGEEFYSDEMPFAILPGQNIVLSVYFKEKTPLQSAVSVWSTFACRTFYKTNCEDICTDTPNEDWKASHQIFPYADADVHKPNIVAGVRAIGLYTDDFVKTVALFGDSITHMSYFSDPLLGLFIKEEKGKICIENYGIGGNRILRDASYFPEMEGDGICFGPAALSRFENDVFSGDKPDCLMLLEGVNDIMHPYVFDHKDEIVTSKDLQEGLAQLISIAHKHETPVFLGTIMPFCQPPMQDWYKESEDTRNSCNQWIRESSDADAILDYDLTIRDKKNTAFMAEDTHLGDWLHPDENGGSIMANLAYSVWKQKQ